MVSDASSGGLRWDIQPPLDRECFELVTEPGEDEGMIRQVEGKTPKLMAPTEYTVTCWLLYKGKAVGPRKTTVTIEVTASPL